MTAQIYRHPCHVWIKKTGGKRQGSVKETKIRLFRRIMKEFYLGFTCSQTNYAGGKTHHLYI
jgi:hypothetical protein